jgi:hypothetical protein
MLLGILCFVITVTAELVRCSTAVQQDKQQDKQHQQLLRQLRYMKG